MSLIQMSFPSKVLNMYVGANIILPKPRESVGPMEKLPVLYLLHGMSDDCTSWQRMTAVEWYALEHNIAVVMPGGGMSCWENMAHGARYSDFVMNELPVLLHDLFPLADGRENTFIAGCSMGGLGALKLGLLYPERFAAIGCFSSPHYEFRPDNSINQNMLARAYGDRIDATDARIVEDAKKAVAGAYPIRLYQSCGEQDLLRDLTLDSKAFFESLGGNLEYRFEMLPGRHDWGLWNENIKSFLNFLGLPKPKHRLF